MNKSQKSYGIKQHQIFCFIIGVYSIKISKVKILNKDTEYLDSFSKSLQGHLNLSLERENLFKFFNMIYSLNSLLQV